MAITIPQSDRFVTYDATAGQTTFAYNFSIYDQDDLTVYQVVADVITELTVVTDYTVTGVGNETGGNIELVVAAALDDEIVILGATPELRSTNYSQAGDFRKESLNTEFNKQIQIDQQLRRDVDRSIHLDPADSSEVSGVGAVNMKLPLVADRANKFVGFDDDGSLIVNEAIGIAGPNISVDKEVALFEGTEGNIIKRPGNEYMIIPQGTTAQRGTPSSIVLRGNNEGSDDVEVYVNGGWTSVLTGGTGAPIGATYITQTSNGTLTNEQAMGDLATGIVKNTTTTGVQSIAVEGTDYYAPGGTDIPVTDGGTGASTSADARVNLGLEIGVDVQDYNDTLESLSLLGTDADKYAYTTGINTWADGDITAFGRSLIDDADAATAQATLGLEIGTDVQAYDANLEDISGLAVTDGNFIVGDGTNFVSESGDTARTSLGLGTASNVSFLNGDFTGTEALKIPVGTTAERPTVPSEGDLRINTTDGATEVYRGAAWINLEAAGAGLTAASQTEMEAGASTTVATTPGRQQYHQSSCKAWVTYSSVGGAATLNASYNIASLTYNGTGDVSINIATDFSSANYSYAGISGRNEGSPNICINNTGANPTSGVLRVATLNTSGTPGHSNFTSITMFGDQ